MLNWKTGEIQNQIVIPQGVIVKILGTRCDGIPDCWNKVDEYNCGFSQLITALIGNLFTVHISYVITRQLTCFNLEYAFRLCKVINLVALKEKKNNCAFQFRYGNHYRFCKFCKTGDV